MRSSFLAGTLGAALLLLPAAAVGQPEREKPTQPTEPARKDEPQKPEIGKPAPDFELTSCDGKRYKLSEHKDKLVVLEWINQDCPVSRRYLPTMKKLARQYVEKDVVWLAVDTTHYQKPAKNKEYVKKNDIPYAILMDADGKVGRRYNAKTTPHMFVINKGVVAYMGAIDDRGERNYVAEALDAILAGKEIALVKTQPFGCTVKYKK